MKRGLVLLFPALLVLIGFSFAYSQNEQIITLFADKLSLNYTQEIRLEEGNFFNEYKKYSENKKEYLEKLKRDFSSKFLSQGLKSDDWGVSFISEYKSGKVICSRLIRCKIYGAASGSLRSPYFRTEWLLKPLLGNRTDLYGFKYLTGKSLIYKGKIKSIPTTILLKFPKTISHCHYHIWYR